MHPCDFLIVAITCALLLLRFLTVCSFWLSTQVQIFFLPIYGGAVKIASEALPQMVPMICRPEDPTLEYLYPLLFYPPSLFCSFSAFCHCSCQPALLRSLKAIKWVFKQKTLACFKVDFSGIRGSTETGLMSHCILSDTFSIDKLRGVGKSKHHHKHKTHGGQRQKSRVTTN